MPNPSTIAILDPLGKHGGFHYYTEQLARGLTRSGAKVTVYITAETRDANPKPYREKVAFAHLYNSDPIWKRILRFLRGLATSIIDARKNGASVMHIHLFNFDIREALAVAGSRLCGMRVVLTVHDIEKFGAPSSNLMRRIILGGSSGQIVHNAYSLQAFTAFKDAPSTPTVVIPHGHYCATFPYIPTREAARSALGLAQEPVIFLFFGNSRKEKALDLLLEACGHLLAVPGWQLVVAGKMKLAQETMYKQIVDQWGLHERVRMDIRHVSDEEAVNYYRAADLVVVPYRKVYESGVTIMAMSLARAVLVSDLQPLVESVDDGRAGIIFRSGEVDSLASALRNAISSRAELDALGDHGLQHARAVRDWDIIGNDTLAFMRSLCRKA